MGPNFINPVLLANGQLKVEGRFETHGAVIDDVLVRFLLVGDGTPPKQMAGTVTLRSNDLTFSKSNDALDLQITRGTFSATVANPAGFAARDKVRGIGVSVAVKAGTAPDPPAFETFTWCVNLEVIPETAPSGP